MLEVGRIARVHGLRGEVVVDLTSDRTERVAPGAMLTAAPVGGGDPAAPGALELRIRSARPHGGRWLVTFEGHADRESVEGLPGRTLFGPPLDVEGVLWVHELVGATVRTPDGREHGVVESVQANPASDLLVLDSGALVPVVFVVDGPSDGVIVVEVPDGLFELFEEGG